MSKQTPRAKVATVFPALLVALAGLALAQTGGPPPPPVDGGDRGEEQEPPPIDLLRPFGEPASPQDELQQLFAEVEQGLRKIDALLWDASTGEDALGADVDSGISKLLQESRAASQSAADSITRILQIAQSQGGGSSGGSLGPPPPPQQQGNDPGEKQREDGEVPEQPAGEKPGGDQPQEADQEQDSGDANQAAGAPDSGDQLPFGHGDAAERWGELPLRVREVFRAEGGEEMPTRYRDWIDTYYRRLGQGR